MKFSGGVLLVSLFFVLFLSTGCTKSVNVISQELHLCPVTSMTVTNDFSGVPGDTTQGEINFVYNAAGNPAELTFSGQVTPFFQGTFTFRYDKQNRLTDYQQSLQTDLPPNSWERYTYLKNGDILDSVFNQGDSSITAIHPDPSSFFRVITLHLDNEKRVQTQTTGGITTTFSYDANGDLIQPGITYDDKVNPLQTNATWMLLSRNYSVHNAIAYNGAPFAKFTYDSHGLPISRVPIYTSANFSLQQDFFTQYFGANTFFSYGCDVGKQVK